MAHMLALLSIFSIVACSATKEAAATTEQPSEATTQNKYANYGEKYRNKYAPKVHNASDTNEVNEYYMNKYAGKYIKQEKARKQAEHAADAEAADTVCDRPGPEPIVVSFEGGIGSGKTTQLEFMRHMKDVLGVSNISSWPEPAAAFGEMAKFWPLAHQVDMLLGKGLPIGEELQAAVNEETIKVQTLFRAAYVSRRAEAMSWACNAKQWGRPVVLLERTTDTQAHVFAPMLHEQGYLTNEGLKEAQTSLPSEPTADFWLYYQISPETVLARIKARGRQGESAINMFMVRHVDALYRKYVANLEASHASGVVRTLDASGDIEQVLQATAEAIWKILHGHEATKAVKDEIASRAREVAPAPTVQQDLRSSSFELALSNRRSDHLEMDSAPYLPIFLLSAALLVTISAMSLFKRRMVSSSDDLSSPLVDSSA